MLDDGEIAMTDADDGNAGGFGFCDDEDEECPEQVEELAGSSDHLNINKQPGADNHVLSLAASETSLTGLELAGYLSKAA